MNYQIVSIDSLRTDPDQPRKFILKGQLEGLAVSIKNEGLVTPIEVDIDSVIITGELRWRAAKIAGLTEVLVRILPTPFSVERFIRQVQSNVHPNTMSAIDTAESLEQIRRQITNRKDFSISCWENPMYGTDGIEEVHDLLGISRATILEYLSLLNETAELKEFIGSSEFSMKKIRMVKMVPEEYRESFKHLIATQINLTEETLKNIAAALGRAYKHAENYHGKLLLQENFEGLTNSEVLEKISIIVLPEEFRYKEPNSVFKLIVEKLNELTELLDSNPLGSFSENHSARVAKALIPFAEVLKNFFKGRIEEMDITQDGLFESGQ